MITGQLGLTIDGDYNDSVIIQLQSHVHQLDRI